MSASILLIEDDQSISEAITGLCATELHAALVVAADGESGMQLAMENAFSLIILDVGLPRVSGFDVCRTLREKKPKQAIMMLTGRDAELDKVLGFELGADDYVTKPFSPREFVARVRALLRRVEGIAAQSEDRTKIKDLEFDPTSRRVWKRGQEIPLTFIEYELFMCLAAAPGKVFTREALISLVLGYASGDYEGAITAHISRLRTKIEDDAGNPEYILTIRGVGYRFAGPDELAD